jgi:hypothetical protein
MSYLSLSLSNVIYSSTFFPFGLRVFDFSLRAELKPLCHFRAAASVSFSLQTFSTSSPLCVSSFLFILLYFTFFRLHSLYLLSSSIFLYFSLQDFSLFSFFFILWVPAFIIFIIRWWGLFKLCWLIIDQSFWFVIICWFVFFTCYVWSSLLFPKFIF